MERITERRQTAADGLSEPTLLSIRTSISQGGIMLKVLVSFGLYRGNLKSFTTPRACLRLAGLGRLIGNYNWAQAVVPVLRSAEIAIKEFFLNVNDDGVEVERTYRIMFKAEQKKAISTLKNRVDELDHRGIPFI